MWSQVLFLVLFSVYGTSVGVARDKRTIGVLFRGLIDAVTRPGIPLAYPPDDDRRVTTRPADSRPQTQIFFVPLPEKQRELKPPAPLKPADLAQIHIHPNLVRQLETLVRTQSIRGKMIAKRFPLNETSEEINAEDNIKAGDNQVIKETPVKTIRTNKAPMKYMIKILPEDHKDKGAVTVTISVGNDGKIRILPGKQKINLDVEMIKPESPVSFTGNSSNTDGERYPSHGLIPQGFPFPIGQLYTTGTPIIPVLVGTTPGGLLHPHSQQHPHSQPHPHYPEIYPTYPSYNPHSVQTYPVNDHREPPPNIHPAPRPYSEVNPYSDFLNLLGLGDDALNHGPSNFLHPTPHHEPHHLPQPNPPPQPHHNMTQVKMIKYTDDSSQIHHNSPPFPSNISANHDSHFPIFPLGPQPFSPGVFPFTPGPQSFTQIPQPYPTGSHHFQSGLPPFNPGHPTYSYGPQSYYQPTASYPSLPPLPTHQGFGNSIGNGFPSKLQSSINYPHRPFHGPSNFHSTNHLSFPQDPYRYPPNFPLRRLKKQTLEKKMNLKSAVSNHTK